MAGIGPTDIEENWWGDVSYNAFTMRDWRNTCDTGYSGGPPMVSGYTEPKPVPVERCAYCGIKAFEEERLCVGCGAPL